MPGAPPGELGVIGEFGFGFAGELGLTGLFGFSGWFGAVGLFGLTGGLGTGGQLAVQGADDNGTPAPAKKRTKRAAAAAPTQ